MKSIHKRASEALSKSRGEIHNTIEEQQCKKRLSVLERKISLIREAGPKGRALNDVMDSVAFSDFEVHLDLIIMNSIKGSYL